MFFVCLFALNHVMVVLFCVFSPDVSLSIFTALHIESVHQSTLWIFGVCINDRHKSSMAVIFLVPQIKYC